MHCMYVYVTFLFDSKIGNFKLRANIQFLTQSFFFIIIIIPKTERVEKNSNFQIVSVVEVKTQVSTRCWGHHCVLLQLLFHVLLHTHACLTTVGPVGVSERLTSETYCDAQRLPSAAVYHRSPGSAVISICFLMSSASLPSAIQRPDWIWRCISMLKRPGFICELLTDSGYHLCNCSMYWSQSQWVRGHTLPGSERLWRRGIYRRMWEEGLEFFFFLKWGCRKVG